jgi:hypothetical protein
MSPHLGITTASALLHAVCDPYPDLVKPPNLDKLRDLLTADSASSTVDGPERPPARCTSSKGNVYTAELDYGTQRFAFKGVSHQKP